MQPLSRSLHEAVNFARSPVTSVDWVSYPILKFPEAPAIEVALLDRPALPPMGAGEAATAPVAAALANAVFDATGVRLRRGPFKLNKSRQKEGGQENFGPGNKSVGDELFVRSQRSHCPAVLLTQPP